MTDAQTSVLRSIEVPYGRVLNYDQVIDSLVKCELTGLFEKDKAQGAIVCGLFQEIESKRLMSFFFSLGLKSHDIFQLYQQARLLGAYENKALETLLGEYS